MFTLSSYYDDLELIFELSFIARSIGLVSANLWIQYLLKGRDVHVSLMDKQAVERPTQCVDQNEWEVNPKLY